MKLTRSEVRDGIAELDSGFMVSDIGWFDSDPETEPDGCMDFENMDPADREKGFRGKGYYARLSAPGYLDCTEWAGPFGSEYKAAEYLVETYVY